MAAGGDSGFFAAASFEPYAGLGGSVVVAGYFGGFADGSLNVTFDVFDVAALGLTTSTVSSTSSSPAAFFLLLKHEK